MTFVRSDPNQWEIDKKLKNKWNEIKDGQLKKKDDDRVYIVDGRERTGKSVLTLQQAAYIDPTMLQSPEEFCSRICFTAEEFLEAIRKTDSTDEITKCIIFDEAFRGLSSRSATSRVNKRIIQALMEVGQKNLVLWIVLPSFFMLDLYPAMLRSHALIHVKKEKNSNRRTFGVYTYKKKAYLYKNGVRKGWNYLPTRTIGRFSKKFPGGEAFEKAYRAKKHKALITSEAMIDKVEEKDKNQLKIIYLEAELKKIKNINDKELAKGYNESNIPASATSIRVNRFTIKQKNENPDSGRSFLAETP